MSKLARQEKELNAIWEPRTMPSLCQMPIKKMLLMLSSMPLSEQVDKDAWLSLLPSSLDKLDNGSKISLLKVNPSKLEQVTKKESISVLSAMLTSKKEFWV